MGIDVDQNVRFQQGEWFVQRVVWVLMAALMAAALVGLFGPGPLSHTTKRTDDGALEVTYHRFMRYLGQDSFTVTASDARLFEDGQLDLWVTRSLFDEVDVRRITPEPKDVSVDGDDVRYTFPVQGLPQDVRITFDITPEGIGTITSSIRARTTPPLQFRQLLYP